MNTPNATRSKAEQFLVDLLNAVPPLHYTDCAFVADLIGLGRESRYATEERVCVSEEWVQNY